LDASLPKDLILEVPKAAATAQLCTNSRLVGGAIVLSRTLDFLLAGVYLCAGRSDSFHPFEQADACSTIAFAMPGLAWQCGLDQFHRTLRVGDSLVMARNYI
jgi:hypothetical protein